MVHHCRWPVEDWDVLAGCPGDSRDGVRFGAFVQGAALFDAAAFGLSSAEAAAMDPQQRMLLQVCFFCVCAELQNQCLSTSSPVIGQYLV
jgi:hypothetical protein